MNVALVMERVEPWRGGAETSTQQFIQHLSGLGVNLELVTRSPLSPTPGMKVHTLRAAGATRAGRSAAFARAANRLVSKLGVDLVHAISPCLGADIYEPRGGTVAETVVRNLALRRSKAGRSLKRLANRLNLRQRLMLDLERRLLSREPRPMIVALSDYVIRQLHEHYEFPNSHIRKIFNGVDPDTTDEAQRAADRAQVRDLYGVAEDDLLVILVAHNFKLKGVGRWIEALQRLVRLADPAPVRSLVIGRDNPARWQRLAQLGRVEDRLGFVGATRRIGAFYHAADVLVHPTYYDPCSRVVLEGMVAGLPCITTRFDGAGEVIEDGVNGFVLDDPEDVDALVERVRQLADPGLRRTVGQQAARVAERASMRGHAEQTVKLYAELAQRSVSA